MAQFAASSGVAPQRTARCAGRRTAKPTRVGQGALRVRATAAGPEAKKDSTPGTKSTYVKPVRSKEKAEVYIGQGKFIRDDPKKYPDKEDFGIMPGATGGWAGGETALWEFRDEIKAKGNSPKKDTGLDIRKITGILGRGDKSEEPTFTTTINGKEVKGVIKGDGKGSDLIYLGADKTTKGKPNATGTFIKDSKRKYPDKEDVGIFAGAVGGFAGGEQGLRQFVEKGEIDLVPPGTKGNQPTSPLVYMGLAAAASGIAAVVLTQDGSTSTIAGLPGTGGLAGGQTVLKSAAALDSTQILLIQAGLATLAGGGLVLGAKSAITGAAKKAKESVEGSLVYLLFWGGVILALKAVLEV